MRRRHAVGALTGALLVLTPSPAPGATGWRCSASALEGTALGGPLPVVRANPGADGCRDEAAGGVVPLPAPLSASVVSASTSLTGPADTPREQQAGATGGVADLRVSSLPTLPVELPPIEIPQGIDAVEVDLTSIADPLDLLPDSLVLDLTPALDPLLPDRILPTAELLRVQTAVAYAAGSCVDGAPRLAGVSDVSGITVLGEVLPSGLLSERTLTLLDSEEIDLSDVDPALVGGLPAGILDLPVLGDQVRVLIQAALDALPPVQVPATLAHVKVQPGTQTTEEGLLVQRALLAEVSIAGQAIADLAAGDARVGAGDVNCAALPPPPPTEPPPPAGEVAPEEASSTDLVLACTERRVVLTDVFRRRGRVRLIGAADREFAGRRVSIVFNATRKVVARTTVRADGSFRTSARLPARRLRRSNRARYRAVVGSHRSLNLKLARRMIVTRMSASGGRVTIAGRVVRPLARPVRRITVTRRVSCTRKEVVGRVRPRRDGRFTVTVPAPEGVRAAVYRLTTRVRKTRRNPKTFPTFTLPRGVNLG